MPEDRTLTVRLRCEKCHSGFAVWDGTVSREEEDRPLYYNHTCAKCGMGAVRTEVYPREEIMDDEEWADEWRFKDRGQSEV